MISAEQSVDREVYVTHLNFIEVLQKMMDSKDEDYEKKAIEHRIRRLRGPFRTDT